MKTEGGTNKKQTNERTTRKNYRKKRHDKQTRQQETNEQQKAKTATQQTNTTTRSYSALSRMVALSFGSDRPWVRSHCSTRTGHGCALIWIGHGGGYSDAQARWPESGAGEQKGGRSAPPFSLPTQLANLLRFFGFRFFFKIGIGSQDYEKEERKGGSRQCGGSLQSLVATSVREMARQERVQDQPVVKVNPKQLASRAIAPTY